MQHTIIPFLILWKPLGYLLVFFAMMIEGDLALFTTGFLTNLRVFDPFDILAIVFAGVLVGDTLWYELGRRLEKHAPDLIKRWIEKIAGPFDEHIRNRPFRTIFISKFTYGVHRIILARAGMLGIKFGEFLKSDIVASSAWIAIVGGLGYFSGLSFELAKHYLKFAEVTLLIALVIFVLLLKLISNRSRREI